MRIDKEVVEEEINVEEDVIIAVDNVVFKRKLTCHNIISEGYKRDINARDINVGNIDAGNIDARNINARNIDAGDINARNIDAGDINAWNINARNIDAGFVVCEERIKKTETAKTMCKNLITKRDTFTKKEVRKVLKNGY